MSYLEPGIIHRFSQSMNSARHAILDKVYNISSPELRGHPDPSFIELSKAISGNAVSEKYCRTKFNANSSNERYFFEFANRIGAYIVFIFIASIQMSLKELKTATDKQNKRTDLEQRIAILRSELFRKSINIGSIFDDFINLLRFLNNPNFEIPIEAFRRVYPGIYK